MDNNTFPSDMTTANDDFAEQAEPVALRTPAGQYGTVLYEWESMSNFSTEKNLNWATSMLLAEVLCVLIALLTRQWFLLFILVGMVVVTYLISRYPAKKNQNAITTLGVVVDGKITKWSELVAFWIVQEPVHTLLGFETKRKLNQDEVILIDDEDPMDMIEIISRYLPQKEKEIPLLDILLETVGYHTRMKLKKLFAKTIKK